MSDLVVSVIIPTYRDGDQLKRCLAGLALQTLDMGRFEVLVVDDGSPDPVPSEWLSAFPHQRLIRQDNAGPASARNMALRHASSPVCVLLNADAVVPPDLLAGHADIHARTSGKGHAVMGRFDWLPEHRTTFVELADRAHVLFPYDLLKPHAPVPAWACWTGNFSVPTAVFRDIGGMDERYKRALFEDVELGQRLISRGIDVIFHPELKCGHDHRMTLDAWMRRAEWMGHEWVRFAQTHGGGAFAILGGRDEPTEAWGRELLAGWLAQQDAQLERIASLQRRCDTLDALATDQGREALMAAVDECSEEAVADIVGINTCAIMRGIHGAIAGRTPTELRALSDLTAGPDARRAVVHSLRVAEDYPKVARLLDILPERTELVVTHTDWLPEGRLPSDPRMTTVRLPTTPASGPGHLFAPVLEASNADVFVLVEGYPLPTRTHLRALFRFAGASPSLGAVGLGIPQGRPHAAATLQDTVPTNALAVRRTHLLADTDDGTGSSLQERLTRQGLLNAVLAPAGSL